MYWIEAEKEVRILCGLARPGTSMTEIERMFGTGNLIKVVRDTAGPRITMRVASPRNLSRNGCVLTIEGGVVRTSEYRD